jgi:predicted N-formylglutamate amidohydrolase
MDSEGVAQSRSLVNALAADPSPVKVRNLMATYESIRSTPPSRLLFLCDHASRELPPEYGALGLDPGFLRTHISHDIGAAEVTRALAVRFGASAVLGRWSRLLIDLNRGKDDPTLVMKLSDGSVIPGNRYIGPSEIAHRIAAFYEPYHQAIAGEITRAQAAGHVPALVSIHSFTPVWKKHRRPWEVGVLWDRDGRLARPLMKRYLISAPEQGAMMAGRLAPILADALAVMGPAEVRFSRPLAPMNGGDVMDEHDRTEIEAAVFRRLVAHLRARTDVQNIDLMITGGFCRNCLGDWYRDAAAEKGIALEKDEARAIVYGMAPSEWKKHYQKEVRPEQQAAFEASQKTHS